MFSLGHWLWLGISGAMIVMGLHLCFRYKPSIDKVLSICCVIAVVSECVKLFSSIEIQPIIEVMVSNVSGIPQIAYQGTGAFVPYLERCHLPLELCSLQIFFIFAARFTKAGERKNILLAFMYLTEVIGGMLAVILPEFLLKEKYDSIWQLFLMPRNYQYFIWHAVLVVLGLYIAFGNVTVLKKTHFLYAVLGLGALDIGSFYLNSLLAVPIYSGGELKGISQSVNFFSSYINPLGIPLTEKSQWMCYLVIRLLCAAVCIAVATAAALCKAQSNKNGH